MIRQYSISIKSGKTDPQIADNVLKDFRCAVSEPSAWLDAGNTTERGLTFLKNNGSLLQSSLFKHQAYFSGRKGRAFTEKKEIEELVYDIIFENYHIFRSDILVRVTEISN